MKLLVIGLGEVGSTVLEETTKKIQEKNLTGWEVHGVDINETKVERAKQLGYTVFHKWAPNYEIYDGYIIAVMGPATVTEVYDNLKRFVHGWGRKTPRKFFVSIESTVTPDFLDPLTDDDKEHLVIVPHRLVFGDPNKGAYNLKRVFGYHDSGGDRNPNKKLAFEFYDTMMDRIPVKEQDDEDIHTKLTSPMLHQTDYLTAILSKMLENAYRFVDIVFAQELMRSCGRQGLDFEKIRQAMNTKWNCDLKEAREGVGGHCLPAQVRQVADVFPDNPFFRLAYMLNEDYKTNFRKAHNG